MHKYFYEAYTDIFQAISIYLILLLDDAVQMDHFKKTDAREKKKHLHMSHICTLTYNISIF